MNSMSGQKLKGIPYTGTLPAVITGTKAGYLHRYKIYGNTEQTGTPTPENPIVPQECGELETIGVHAGQYKLTLTSAGQSVDIYLGESQTTRQIKKLVLTGEENWRTLSTPNYTYAVPITTYLVDTTAISSHFIQRRTLQNLTNKTFMLANSDEIYIKYNDKTSVNDFKQFLSDQYANGTPVTIWYVLATEETGTVNEPLRKIGNYADTIDSTQTSAQIPTSSGSTTISWAGSGLAPSQFDSIQEWVDIPTYTYTNGEWVADN